MNVLTVTGASGYLGGRLVRRAAEDSNLRVRALVRRAAPWLPPDTVQIRNLVSEAERAISGSKFVIHLAGANEVAAATDPQGTLADTVSAARSVASACRRQGVSRLIYVSTVHVYGRSLEPGAVIDERTPPEPRSPYAVARLAAEQTITSLSDEVEVVILRLTNAVGAAADPSVDRWSLVGNDLCRQVACGQPITLKSSGQQWRDFVALSDVVDIVIAAARDQGLSPGIYNVGSGSPTTIRQFANLVAQVARSRGFGQPDVIAPPADLNPPEPYRVSVEKLSAMGYEARTPLSEAVTETLSFCTNNRRQICTGSAS